MLKDVHWARMDLAKKLVVVCKRYKWEFGSHTPRTASKLGKEESNGCGRDNYEANIPPSVAFRELGKGHQ